MPRLIDLIDFWCLNSTFNNISATSWRPVLVVGEAGVPGENHRPWVINWYNLYVYKAQHGKAPSYLQELIALYKPNRALRSENSMLLHPPNDVRTKSYGEKRFDKAAPTLWNSLPLSLRNVNSLDVFKKRT